MNTKEQKKITLSDDMIINFDQDDDIPFVVALDLLEQSRKKLTDKEAALIGLTLITLLKTPKNKDHTTWSSSARIASTSRRMD